MKQTSKYGYRAIVLLAGIITLVLSASVFLGSTNNSLNEFSSAQTGKKSLNTGNDLNHSTCNFLHSLQQAKTSSLSNNSTRRANQRQNSSRSGFKYTNAKHKDALKFFAACLKPQQGYLNFTHSAKLFHQLCKLII